MNSLETGKPLPMCQPHFLKCSVPFHKGEFFNCKPYISNRFSVYVCAYGRVLYVSLICIVHNSAFTVHSSYCISSFLLLTPSTTLQILFYLLTLSTLIHYLSQFNPLYNQFLIPQDPEPSSCPSKFPVSSQN